MKLSEIKDQSFFVHDGIVKYKMGINPNKNESVCYIVTVGNINNKSLSNIRTDDRICCISNQTMVKKWSINNIRLEIYSFNNFNILLDLKFNAYDFRNTNMSDYLSFNMYNHSFYEGEVVFDVIDGLILTDSVKLYESQSNNDKEKILDFLYSKFVNNFGRQKDIIFNTLFIKNKLFNYINEVEEKLDVNKNNLGGHRVSEVQQINSERSWFFNGKKTLFYFAVLSN